MELFDYLMAKKGHNTHRDLFSYLLGKNAGGSGTYTTFSGTSLNISNTLQAKIKNIALEGNTSQETTTGKNLFDKDNQVKVQVNAGGTLRYGIIVDAPNKKVSISAKSWNNSIAVKQLINGTYGDFLNINSNTTLDVVDKLIIYATSDTAKLDLNIEKLQVEINDVPTGYEPYTGGQPSPSPDYPQPIKVVTGEQNVEIKNKNLFDKSNYSNYRIVSRTTGELVQNNSFGTTGYIKVKANQTYYQSNVNAYYSVLYDENKEYYGIIGTEKFTPAIDGYIRTSFPRSNLNLVQIEIGEVATTYVPYQSQPYPLSLGNIELARIGNYKDYIFKNVVGSHYYNADLDLNEWYLHKETVDENVWEMNWKYENATDTPVPRTVLRLANMISRRNYLSNCFLSSEMNNQQIINRLVTNGTTWFLSLDNTLSEIETSDSNSVKRNKIVTYLQSVSATICYGLATPTNTKITDTTLISQLENINNNARSYKDTTIIECTSASTDNETIGFSGEIKVTSVGLGNSLNTSLLSSNLQEETNTNDIQEEQNLDEIEEQNDEPTEIEEPIEEEYQEL